MGIIRGGIQQNSNRAAGIRPAAFFYGANQTERIPSTISASNHNVESNGLKKMSGIANEAFGGGISYNFGNINDLADADASAKVDLDNSYVQINESGIFNIKTKHVGNQIHDANLVVALRKVMQGTDDIKVIGETGWRQNIGTIEGLDADADALYESEEQYLQINSGDQFYLRMHNQSAGLILAGYVQFERIE